MYYTEEEAKQKLAICKHDLCQASACIKWEWQEPEYEYMDARKLSKEEFQEYIEEGWEIDCISLVMSRKTKLRRELIATKGRCGLES